MIFGDQSFTVGVEKYEGKKLNARYFEENNLEQAGNHENKIRMMKSVYNWLFVSVATFSISFISREKLYAESESALTHKNLYAASLKIGSLSYRDSTPPYLVSTQDFSLYFDSDGKITGYVNRSRGKLTRIKISGSPSLEGFKTVGKTTVKSLTSGGYEFSRSMVNSANDSCRFSEYYIPTKNSIRMEVKVTSNSVQPWTTPLSVGIKYPSSRQLRFWTSWVDDRIETQSRTDENKTHRQGEKIKPAVNNWSDPLSSRPFVNNTWNYGNWIYGSQEGGGICLPVATILDKANNIGLSLIVSPEQPLLWLQLKTGADGTVRFQHNSLKYAEHHPVEFAFDFVQHEPEWRGGLRWMTERYAGYFNPVIEQVDEMAGMGAYSHFQGKPDTAFLRKVNFRANWDASFGWPYFGMFFPPLNHDVVWKSCGADERGDIVPALIKDVSYQSMDDYNIRMRKMGFFVLNYFNVTEFGSKINKTSSGIQPDTGDVWKDPNAYLYTKMPDGIFRNQADAGPVYTWGKAVVIDPGDAEVQQNCIGQVRNYLNNLPNSAGICIDRMDHLLRINFADGADDRIGWYNNRSGRFLGFSWLEIMSKIGPMMHEKKKAIFVNPVKYGHRLEWFKEVDGIYDEYGYKGYALNGSALIGLRKPVLTWTVDTNAIKPNPDRYFQRLLYMGAYPMAPFEGNDHSIRPGTWADQYYLDYGPLFSTIRDKKWVLSPNCVETSAPGTRVNLFQVPDGYVLPVIFNDNADVVTVFVRNIKGLESLKCEVLLPGSKTRVPVEANLKNDVLEIKVPTRRGCAMVKLSHL